MGLGAAAKRWKESGEGARLSVGEVVDRPDDMREIAFVDTGFGPRQSVAVDGVGTVYHLSGPRTLLTPFDEAEALRRARLNDWTIVEAK